MAEEHVQKTLSNIAKTKKLRNECSKIPISDAGSNNENIGNVDNGPSGVSINNNDSNSGRKPPRVSKSNGSLLPATRTGTEMLKPEIDQRFERFYKKHKKLKKKVKKLNKKHKALKSGLKTRDSENPHKRFGL